MTNTPIKFAPEPEHLCEWCHSVSVAREGDLCSPLCVADFRADVARREGVRDLLSELDIANRAMWAMSVPVSPAEAMVKNDARADDMIRRAMGK